MSRAPRDWDRYTGLAVLVLDVVILIALVAAILYARSGCSAELPREAHQYRRALIREAQLQFGLDAPVARFAAQIHQESSWRANAKSRYADGLAQFTPSTAAWISKVYPKQLANPVPYSPVWAIRALVIYDRHLHDRAIGHTACDRWWATLRHYNGGAVHWQKEARLAVDPLDRASVDAQCGKASRAAVYCAENLGYPRKIMLQWEPLYRAAGWPGEPVCSLTL